MNIYQAYADAWHNERKFKLERVALKPRIEGYVKQADDKVKNEFGTFLLYPVKAWTYSSEIEKAELRLDKLKAKEQSNGTAKLKIDKSLRYIPK